MMPIKDLTQNYILLHKRRCLELFLFCLVPVLVCRKMCFCRTDVVVDVVVYVYVDVDGDAVVVKLIATRKQ